MPRPLPSTDFYVQHSPFGAFASFTLGRYGKQGGMGLELNGPARQDVYLTLIRSGRVTAFPFFEGALAGQLSSDGAEAYTTSAVRGTVSGWQVVSPGEITRTLGWASDTWQAGDLTFSVFTPFGPLDDLLELGDEQLRQSLLPAIFAELTVDNTRNNEESIAFFGLGHTDPLRPLSDTVPGLRGIARENQFGIAVTAEENGFVQELLTWSLPEAVALASRHVAPPLHRLANRGGVLLAVPPGERRTYTLVLGFYRGGIVTSGIATSYLYSRLFPDLEAVLQYGITHAERYIAQARDCDQQLDNSPLSEERKFLLAHATHSYLGSTMLLHDERAAVPRSPFSPAGSLHRPLWVVNEGEYRMLNTFDLTVDHAFFEMQHHPWTLKNTLDLFINRYSYIDPVQDATDPERPQFPGGISFTHDMGVANQFSPPGYSSYERPDLEGCFSYMTQEQLVNWCLCAALYGLPTRFGRGDTLWLTARRQTLTACLHSLLNRDAPESLRNGMMSFDAARCGTGQEITTYDSLDPSLGQARASMYLAVKCWAAYLALSRCFDVLGEDDKAAEAEEQAAQLAATIANHWIEESESFPAVFEPDNPGYASRVLPAIEGLVFPYCWNDEDAISPDGPYGQLISLLCRHFKAALVPGVCIDAVSGGLKISSTSENTWMSKLFLVQFVAEEILQIPLSEEFDVAHARWQREGNCRDFAFTDQVRSTDGGDLGSRYYPRGVTAILWLESEPTI